MKILVVDDNVDFADSLAEVLELEGHKAATAYDGDTALSILGREPFDLVLLDLRLPGRSGGETLEAIRARDPDLKVLVLTGVTAGEMPTELAGLRPSAVLQKPIEMPTLLALIRELDLP